MTVPITMISPTECLERFERDISEQGFGKAPNGASYRLITFGQQKTPAVERVYRGERTVVVGFSSRSFNNSLHAKSWALVDGRHEYVEGVPIHLRRQLV